jgi:hypothetical protein
METQKDTVEDINEMGLEDPNYDGQFNYDEIQRQNGIDLAEQCKNDLAEAKRERSRKRIENDIALQIKRKK